MSPVPVALMVDPPVAGASADRVTNQALLVAAQAEVAGGFANVTLVDAGLGAADKAANDGLHPNDRGMVKQKSALAAWARSLPDTDGIHALL